MPLPTMGLIPKPQPSWPVWLVVLYYIGFGIIALIAVGGPIWKSVKFVPKNHAGMRERNGKPRRRKPKRRELALPGWEPDADGKIWSYVAPGLRFMVPFTDSIATISCRTFTADVPNPRVELRFGKKLKQYFPDIKLNWRVINTPQGIHDALYETEELKDTVIAAAGESVSAAVETHAPSFNRGEVAQEVMTYLKPRLLPYGVEARSVNVVSVPRSPEQTLGDALRDDDVPDEMKVGAAARIIGLAKPDGA